jgi:putative transposase
MSTPKHRTALSASYFITTKCWQGRTIFQVPENAEILLETLFKHREAGAYLLHEFVIMPDHFHLLLTPSQGTSLEKAMQLIKGGTSYEIHKRRGTRGQIWQQGFHDWTIRDEEDWRTKAEYIALNPVRSRLVENFRSWPYSSASGKFRLDLMPERFSKLSSGAKALLSSPVAQGLKPLPPKETPIPQGLKPLSIPAGNVGPKGPTPNTFSGIGQNVGSERPTLKTFSGVGQNARPERPTPKI